MARLAIRYGLDLDAKPSGGWSFSQVPQLLLSGDSDKPIK
jgi:hypothetical protein